MDKIRCKVLEKSMLITFSSNVFLVFAVDCLLQEINILLIYSMLLARLVDHYYNLHDLTVLNSVYKLKSYMWREYNIVTSIYIKSMAEIHKQQ